MCSRIAAVKSNGKLGVLNKREAGVLARQLARYDARN